MNIIEFGEFGDMSAVRGGAGGVAGIGVSEGRNPGRPWDILSWSTAHEMVECLLDGTSTTQLLASGMEGISVSMDPDRPISSTLSWQAFTEARITILTIVSVICMPVTNCVAIW
jgi:hypothetical protein